MKSDVLLSDVLKVLKALPAEPPRVRVGLVLSLVGRTQRELADALGMDEGLLSNALSGRRQFTEQQEQNAADFLSVPVGVLFPKVAQ